MKQQSALIWLVPLIAILAIAAASVGLFSSGGETFSFTSVHGQTVEMYGRGIYKNNSLMRGAGFVGTDAVTLLVVIPFLLVSYILSLRGSPNGQILLIGALFFFLYNGASMAFSATFNALFLVYTALFSASLFATITALTTFDLPSLAGRVQPGFPHRGLAILTITAGLGTFFLWMSEIVGPIISGTVPALLGPDTTMFTHAFDSAVITPAAVLTGIFLLQRKPIGYLLAAPILILCTLIGVAVIGQTIYQTMAGIVFPVGVYVGMVGSWVVMGAFSIGLTISYFRHLS